MIEAFDELSTSVGLIQFYEVFNLGSADIDISCSGEKEAADLNGNGFVDTDDLSRFSNQWLESGVLEANFDQQGNVDFIDWAILAENWLFKAIWYHD